MPMSVNFKIGSQTSINAILTGLANNSTTVIPGSFYLTRDTNRLYFAQADNRLEHLNQYVHIWENTGLPNISTGVELGDIYYLKNDNILAIYTQKDNANQWIQLNPDTYLAASTSAVTVAANNTNGINGVSIATQIQDKNGGTIQHTAEGSFKLIGGTNVSITNSGNDITIAATDTNTTYTLSATASSKTGFIRLTDNATTPNAQSVSLIGADGITITSTNNNALVISGSNPVSGVANTFNASGVFATTVSISNSSDIVSTGITPTIEYGGGTTKSVAVFNGSTAATPKASLDVYTTDEVDQLINNKLASADAMTFKGVLGSEQAILTAINLNGDNNKPVAGDTYKISVGEAFTFAGTETKTIDETTYNIPSDLRNASIHPGDLLIATGTDEDITWAIIPSGDDQLLSVVFNNTAKAMTIHDGISNTNIGTYRLAEDTTTGNSIIGISSTLDTDTNSLVTTISHGAAGTGSAVSATEATSQTTQSTDTEFEIPIVTGISKDTHGHITDITLQKYKFKDTHTSLKNITVKTSVENNVGLYGMLFSLIDGEAKGADLYLKSDNLTITKLTTGDEANKGFKVNLEWDEF